MSFLSRWRRRTDDPGTGARAQADAAARHLEDFVRTRVGVEVYVEPATTVTPTTVVLVATTGEWTRRRVDGPKGAAELARRLSLPVYDVTVTGYPPRMRAWNARRAERERQAASGAGEHGPGAGEPGRGAAGATAPGATGAAAGGEDGDEASGRARA
jgi:hypothetical protein